MKCTISSLEKSANDTENSRMIQTISYKYNTFDVASYMDNSNASSTYSSELTISGDSQTKHEKSSNNKLYLGLLMATTSSFFFSLCSLFVKLLGNVFPIELAIFRFLGILLPSLPILIMSKENPIGPQGKRTVLLFRGILGAIGLMAQFYAIRHMPLADSAVIIFSAPVFVTVFARIFLKEACSLVNVIITFVTIIGVIFIAKPPALFGGNEDLYLESTYFNGLIAAFGGTLFSASVYVLLRALKDVHYSVVMSSFAVTAIILSTIVTGVFGYYCIPPMGKDRYIILLIGVFSFSGQYLLTKASQMEQAGPVSICRTADIVFSIIWQIIFFQEWPSVTTFVGAFLVMGSVIILGLRKWVMHLPDKHPAKSYLAILTI